VTWLLVALGAAVGAPVRYVVDRALAARLGTGFPYGTLAVNVAGSFALGLLVGAAAGQHAMALAGTGFCGALTTYSTFSWEAVRLAAAGRRARAAGYVAASVGLGLAAAAGGVALAG
jgi:fluoride exporter